MFFRGYARAITNKKAAFESGFFIKRILSCRRLSGSFFGFRFFLAWRLVVLPLLLTRAICNTSSKCSTQIVQLADLLRDIHQILFAIGRITVLMPY